MNVGHPPRPKRRFSEEFLTRKGRRPAARAGAARAGAARAARAGAARATWAGAAREQGRARQGRRRLGRLLTKQARHPCHTTPCLTHPSPPQGPRRDRIIVVGRVDHPGGSETTPSSGPVGFGQAAGGRGEARGGCRSARPSLRFLAPTASREGCSPGVYASREGRKAGRAQGRRLERRPGANSAAPVSCPR